MDRTLLATAAMSMGLVGCPALLSDDFRIVTDGQVADDGSGASDANAGSSSGSIDGTVDSPANGDGAEDSSRDGTTDATADGVSGSGSSSGSSGGTSTSSGGNTSGGSGSSSGSSGGSTGSSGGGGGCEAGETTCGGRCVSTATDSSNCGTCGHSCRGTSCSAGLCVPQTIASGQSEAYGVAVDDVNVYWTTFTGGTVMQAPVTGGAPTTIASGLANPTNIQVDAVNVYWAGSGLHSAPIGGGTVMPYVTDAFFLGIYGATIYFSTGSGLVQMVPKAGGSAVTLLTPPGQEPFVIAADATNVYFVMENGNSGASSTVLQAPATPSDGGATLTLASGQGNTSSIATDGTNVYWANPASGTICQTPVGGGTIVTLATSQGSGSVAIDNAYVYWASGTAGTVTRTPKGGGPLHVIASNQAGVGGFAVGNNYIAWATYGSVIVMAK